MPTRLTVRRQIWNQQLEEVWILWENKSGRFQALQSCDDGVKERFILVLYYLKSLPAELAHRNRQ